jgi:hypothetical protein
MGLLPVLGAEFVPVNRAKSTMPRLRGEGKPGAPALARSFARMSPSRRVMIRSDFVVIDFGRDK